jgi:DivIVA domain-containing protein
MAVTREPEFGTVRMREGYDLDEVDDFVDVVIDALEGASDAVTPEQIERYEFRVVRMKTSYVMEDVDRWLDAAAAELRQAARAPGPQRAGDSAPPVATPAHAGSGAHGRPYGASAPERPAPGGDARLDLAATAAWPPPPAPPVVAPPVSPAPPVPPVPAYDPPVAYTPPAPAYDQPAWDAPAYDGPPTAPPAAPPLPTTPAVPASAPSGESDPRRAAALIHHVELWVRDFDAAVASFGWLFQRIGWRIGRVWEHGCAWTSSGGPYIVIESGPDLRWMPHDRRSPGMNHIAFEVADRATVDRIVAEGPSRGWQLMFPDRHPWAGGPDHYAAYLENAEGFEVEIVAAQ